MDVITASTMVSIMVLMVQNKLRSELQNYNMEWAEINMCLTNCKATIRDEQEVITAQPILKAIIKNEQKSTRDSTNCNVVLRIT